MLTAQVFVCRQKFSGLSWSCSPELPNSLMQTAYHFLASYFSVAENSVKDIQYRQLLEWTKGCLYFNHVTNLVDRSTISMYLDEYIGQFLFEQHNPFRSEQLSRKALEQVINLKTDELRNLPDITASKVMLSPAADRLLQIVVSASTLAQVKSFSDEAGTLHIAEATEMLQKLIKVVDQPARWKKQMNSTAGELARVRVIRLEVGHVEKEAHKIREEIDNMELCLLEGFWPSPATLATIGHVLQGLTPLQWRASFPTASSKLAEWVERVESIVTYLPSLLNSRELQVMSLSRLANPSRFILALLLETGGNPDGLSLKVEMVDKNKELEQLHAGCYLDTLYLYGGRIVDGEIYGATDHGKLWQDIGLVKVTPVETSRTIGARVVQLPLHTRLLLNNTEEEDDPPVLYISMRADLHQSFWTLKKAKFFLIPPTV